MKVMQKVVAALSFGFVMGAHAQDTVDFPAKGPVSLVVGFPAGGGADTIARYVAQKLSDKWRVPVVVENRPGASGVLSAAYVGRAAPDGYTILLAGTNMVQLSATMPDLPFDISETLTPVVQLARVGTLLIAPNSLPASSLDEFIDMVKAEPGKHSFGSYGVGTSSQMFGELLNQATKIDLLHVAYKGAAQAISQGVLGNSVSLAVVDAGSGTPYARSGQVKALAVTGTERLKQLPDVPTTSELGIDAMNAYGWYALFTPVSTPPGIAGKINSDMREIIGTSDYRQRMETMGLLQPVSLSTDQFKQVFERDTEYWEGVIKATGVGAVKP